MAQFSPKNASKSPQHESVYQTYGYIYNVVDFIAGLCFLTGSVMFFWDGVSQYAGTWLFVIGSALFILRPAVKLAREFHLAQLPE